jgi:low temperature requirement protein LtrA
MSGVGAPSQQRPSLLRAKSPHGHHRVTFVELFFDLVFVFAVTQVSHTMLAHFTPLGVFQTLVLLLAVWWVWIYTSWVTNWLDPEKLPVRLLLFVLMIAGLVMSTAIPKAFETRGLAFAGAYAFMQVGRSTFMLCAVWKSDAVLKENFQRIVIWLAIPAVFWIAGAFAAPDLRLQLWIVALVIEYLGALVRFWVPGLGASSTTDWNVEGGHLAERCGLFIIIALGESIVVTGATFSEHDWNAGTVGAFVSACVAAIAMWWIYFHKGADAGAERISHSDDPGRMARLAYTYLHLLIVAGIIVTAVGDELVLAHPGGLADAKAVISLIGGPLLFMIGVILFKHTIHGWYQLSHIAGIGGLVGLIPLSFLLSPLTLSAATSLVLVVVCVWEAMSLKSGPMRQKHPDSPAAQV